MIPWSWDSHNSQHLKEGDSLLCTMGFITIQPPLGIIFWELFPFASNKEIQVDTLKVNEFLGGGFRYF